MTALSLLFFALLGAVAGVVHFGALSREADLIAGGGTPSGAIGLRIGRMLLTIGVLACAVRFGALTLIAAAVGLMAARQGMLRKLGQRGEIRFSP